MLQCRGFSMHLEPQRHRDTEKREERPRHFLPVLPFLCASVSLWFNSLAKLNVDTNDKPPVQARGSTAVNGQRTSTYGRLRYRSATRFRKRCSSSVSESLP